MQREGERNTEGRERSKRTRGKNSQKETLSLTKELSSNCFMSCACFTPVSLASEAVRHSYARKVHLDSLCHT